MEIWRAVSTNCPRRRPLQAVTDRGSRVECGDPAGLRRNWKTEQRRLRFGQGRKRIPNVESPGRKWDLNSPAGLQIGRVRGDKIAVRRCRSFYHGQGEVAAIDREARTLAAFRCQAQRTNASVSSHCRVLRLFGQDGAKQPVCATQSWPQTVKASRKWRRTVLSLGQKVIC